MMKTCFILSLIPVLLGAVHAQMPSSFDASGRSEQARSGAENNDPARVGEPSSPQLFGMEIPLLDPANDTMSYNGISYSCFGTRTSRVLILKKGVTYVQFLQTRREGRAFRSV